MANRERKADVNPVKRLRAPIREPGLMSEHLTTLVILQAWLFTETVPRTFLLFTVQYISIDRRTSEYLVIQRTKYCKYTSICFPWSKWSLKPVSSEWIRKFMTHTSIIMCNFVLQTSTQLFTLTCRLKKLSRRKYWRHGSIQVTIIYNYQNNLRVKSKFCNLSKVL